MTISRNSQNLLFGAIVFLIFSTFAYSVDVDKNGIPEFENAHNSGLSNDVTPVILDTGDVIQTLPTPGSKLPGYNLGW